MLSYLLPPPICSSLLLPSPPPISSSHHLQSPPLSSSPLPQVALLSAFYKLVLSLDKLGNVGGLVTEWKGGVGALVDVEARVHGKGPSLETMATIGYGVGGLVGGVIGGTASWTVGFAPCEEAIGSMP